MRFNGFCLCKFVWSFLLIILYWDGFNKRKIFILNKIKIKLILLGLCRIIIFIDEVFNVFNDVLVKNLNKYADVCFFFYK